MQELASSLALPCPIPLPSSGHHPLLPEAAVGPAKQSSAPTPYACPPVCLFLPGQFSWRPPSKGAPALTPWLANPAASSLTFLCPLTLTRILEAQGRNILERRILGSVPVWSGNAAHCF